MPVIPERSPEASPLRFHSPHDPTQLISEEAVEILLPVTLLLKNTGITPSWRIFQGTCFTKEVQQGLQGKEVELTTHHDKALFDTPDRGVQARIIPCV
jgi:hypothetical protein